VVPARGNKHPRSGQRDSCVNSRTAANVSVSGMPIPSESYGVALVHAEPVADSWRLGSQAVPVVLAAWLGGANDYSSGR
jgi:hypothetical protein